MAIDRKGWRRLLFCPAAAAVILATAMPARTEGPSRSEPGRTARRSAAPDLAERPIVRLNFVSTPWPKVLQHVADETRSTLVMHDVPEGRFSRRDLRGHTRTEAVQILNQPLEALGFRILEKDNFLTVIQIQRARLEYPRHVVSQANQASRSDSPDTETGFATGKDVGTAHLSPQSQRRRGNGAIQRAGFEAEPAPTASESADSDGNATAAMPGATETIELVTIVPDRPVTDVAKQLYAAFGARAELIPTQPDRLPAFRVYREPKPADAVVKPKLWFVLEMDTALNEMHVHAPPKVAAGVGALIRKLDSAPPGDGETVRLVPDAEQAAVVAGQLNAQLAELRRQRRSPSPENPFALAQAQTPADDRTGNSPEAAPPDADPTQPGENALQVLGNLRGDVSVDALADLDLLLLRGNERDVEEVMKVIELIENMALGATPGIELFFLQNVDSEALAALLNDVYTRLTTISAGTAASARQTRAVNVVAVGSPNAILVLAPQNAIDGVLDLAEQLDQPQAPGTEVQVFFLKNAVASQVVTLLEGFYEERPGLGTSIRVVADSRTNSVIVNASPKELLEVTKLVREIDSKQSRATAQVRVVPLKNALADDLATFITSVIQGVVSPAQTGAGQQFAAAAGAGTNQALRDAKSMVLEFLTNDGAAQKIVRSGVLSDIRITGDIRSNTLTVTAPESSMSLVLELIAVLDQPTSAFADIKAFTLDRADAEMAGELLESLFPAPDEGQPGVQIAGAEGFGSALIPLRVSVDTRTNTVVAVGSPEVLRMVEAIIFRIDQDSARNRKIEVLRMRNSPAADVAASINQFLQSQRELLQIVPDRISATEILEQEVIVTPEPISNNLIISATPRYFDQILSLARQLDREPPQVTISSLIVEVTLEDTDEFGLELGFQDPVLFSRSVLDPPVTITQTVQSPNGNQTQTQQIISQSGVPGFPFNNLPLGNNLGVNSSQVGKQALTNFALGRVNDSLGFGGLVLSASSESVSVLLRALASHRHVQVLSNPHVLALDNQEAQILQGQVVPIVDGVTIGATGLANPNITQSNAGIILTVTPRISLEGQIVMQVIAEKSQYDLSGGVPVFTDGTTGNVITSPIKNVTTAITTAKVQDGQTIVIGGLITKSEDVVHNKVPYLADVPIIGNAFRYDSRQFRRTELLIFLTPRIVHGDADVELIKQVEMERMHFFEDEAELIHGPLMGVPAESAQPLGGPTVVFPDGTSPVTEPPPMILGPESTPELENAPPSLPPATPVEPRKSMFRTPNLLKR